MDWVLAGFRFGFGIWIWLDNVLAGWIQRRFRKENQQRWFEAVHNTFGGALVAPHYHQYFIRALTHRHSTLIVWIAACVYFAWSPDVARTGLLVVCGVVGWITIFTHATYHHASTTSFNFHEMGYYPIEHVLAVATIHPFYQPTIQFPPDSDQIYEVVSSSTGLSSPTARSLTSVPLTHKKDLYQTIQRLGSDRDPRNNYRRSSYISVTGGGSGGVPMMFATDGRENRNQRSTAGRLIQACGVIESNDWVLTVHSSGALYRSLDLVTEILENAGASVLCAGHLMSHANLVKLCVAHRVNVVCGESGQILQFALHVAGLPPATRDALCINKVIYTSEPLVRAQRRYLTSVLGPVSICSLFASAESGPWAVMNLALTGDVADDAADFIFDSRAMCVEVLPLSAVNEDQPQSGRAREIHALPDGEKGAIILTSLQRLRNPLVRYVTGDVGSLHPLPAAAIASIPDEIAPRLRVLRLQGRDQRFSFKWQGEYFEFHF